MNEELLTRIADALELVGSSLEEVSVSLERLDRNLSDCITSPAHGSGKLLRITGSVITQ